MIVKNFRENEKHWSIDVNLKYLLRDYKSGKGDYISGSIIGITMFYMRYTVFRKLVI